MIRNSNKVGKSELSEAWRPLTEAQRKELDRRLDACRLNPDEGSPWDDVKADIRKAATIIDKRKVLAYA